MDVTDAVRRRRSIRAFLDTPVEDDVVAELLELAARAPSGGNVQPWRVYVITAATMPRFLEHLASRVRVRVHRFGRLVVEDESHLGALEVGSTDPHHLAELAIEQGLVRP